KSSSLLSSRSCSVSVAAKTRVQQYTHWDILLKSLPWFLNK
ncbi:unnamed protein product, partial [Mycena citricolor]